MRQGLFNESATRRLQVRLRRRQQTGLHSCAIRPHSLRAEAPGILSKVLPQRCALNVGAPNLNSRFSWSDFCRRITSRQANNVTETMNYSRKQAGLALRPDDRGEASRGRPTDLVMAIRPSSAAQRERPTGAASARTGTPTPHSKLVRLAPDLESQAIPHRNQES
jgi:hypothetical protein